MIEFLFDNIGNIVAMLIVGDRILRDMVAGQGQKGREVLLRRQLRSLRGML